MYWDSFHEHILSIFELKSKSNLFTPPFSESFPWSIVIPVIVTVPAVVLVATVYLLRTGQRCRNIYKDAKCAARSDLVIENAKRITTLDVATSGIAANNAAKCVTVETKEKEEQRSTKNLDQLKISLPAPSRGYITLAKAMSQDEINV